jgi:hypothetical protein
MSATATIITSNVDSDSTGTTTIKTKVSGAKPRKKRRIVKRRPKRMPIKAVFFDLYGVFVR